MPMQKKIQGNRMLPTKIFPAFPYNSQGLYIWENISGNWFSLLRRWSGWISTLIHGLELPSLSISVPVIFKCSNQVLRWISPENLYHVMRWQFRFTIPRRIDIFCLKAPLCSPTNIACDINDWIIFIYPEAYQLARKENLCFWNQWQQTNIRLP